MENDLHRLLDILIQSCTDVIECYFQLPQAGGDRVYRERVYCYEVYHQMRSRWAGFPYSLGGEIDKSGHPLFRGGPYRHSKPDFLVHIPGNMGENLAVVEVKASTATYGAMTSDIKKLSWYCAPPAEYFCGIFLVYGHETECDKWWDDLVGQSHGRIAILRHLHPGEPARVIAFSGL